MTTYTVPSPKTWSDGDIPTYDQIQAELYDTVNFILNPPAIKLRQTTNQTLTNGAWSYISWDGAEMDTHGAWNSAGNKTMVTPQVPGWYLGWASVAFNTSGSYTVGQRDIEARLNDTDSMIMHKNVPPDAFSGDTYIKPSGLSFLVPCNGTTDFVQIRAYQSSGGSMTTIANRTDYQPQLYLKWHCRL